MRFAIIVISALWGPSVISYRVRVRFPVYNSFIEDKIHELEKKVNNLNSVWSRLSHIDTSLNPLLSSINRFDEIASSVNKSDQEDIHGICSNLLQDVKKEYDRISTKIFKLESVLQSSWKGDSHGIANKEGGGSSNTEAAVVMTKLDSIHCVVYFYFVSIVVCYTFFIATEMRCRHLNHSIYLSMGVYVVIMSI